VSLCHVDKGGKAKISSTLSVVLYGFEKRKIISYKADERIRPVKGETVS